jgi:hypothetical protein
MALQKALFSIGFNGLQTKYDPQTAATGTYQIVDNYVINKYHLLEKSPGFGSIATKTPLTNITTMYSLGNESGAITDKGLYAYSPAVDQYLLKSNVSIPTITSKPIIANTYVQTNTDSSITRESVMGIVWEDTRTTGTIRCSVKDLINDTILSGDVVLSTSATAIKPKCIAAGANLFFTWADSSANTISIVKYVPLTQTFSSAQIISSSLGAQQVYDVGIAQGNLVIFVAETLAVPYVVKAYYWNTLSNILGSSVNSLFNPVGVVLSNFDLSTPTLAVSSQGAYFVLAWQNTAKQVYTCTVDFTLTKFANSEVRLATATTNAGWTIACTSDNTGGNSFVYYTTKSGTTWNTYLAKCSNNQGTPTVTSNAQIHTQLGVVSKAQYYNGNAYVTLGYDSIFQPTYFLIRDDGVCSARLFAGIAGGNTTRANVTSSWSLRPDKTNTFVGAFLKKTKIQASQGTYLSTTSVFSEQIFFTPYAIDNKAIRNTLLMAGGYLKQYDGQSTVTEQGFHLYPEQPSYTTASGSIPAGAYSYICCWEWTDNYGQIIRSNTSVPLTITLGSSLNVTLTVPTLPITSKTSTQNRTDAVLAVYRTVTNGTTYYRVNQTPSTYVYNNPVLQTVSFVDSTLDSVLLGNAVLYTTGGIFTNISLPTTNLMAISKNRVIVAGTDNETNKVYYSKEKEEGLGVEFSNELSFIVDNLGGDITALAAMDDKILIFKKSLIFFVAGGGADKLGNGSFSVPQLVSTDCGCSQPQSIVLTGLGIMFKSQKGIYLIDRQLGVTYIGNNVDAYNQYTLTSATNLPDQNLVTFTTLEGYTLKYDTYFQQWFTSSLTPVTASTLNGTNWYISNSTNSFVSTPTEYSIAGEPIVSSLKTNWISVANIGGFQRIFAILLTGVDKGNVDRITINLRYDFQDYVSQTLTLQPNKDNTTYGTNTYGTESPYGTTNKLQNMYLARPKQQKCSSIQIEIVDGFPQGNPTSGFGISDISLVVGVKGTYNKGLSPLTQRLV